MINPEDKERVREAIDFVSLVGETVVLKERGSGDFWGCCPFHQEKSPSFHVRSSTGLWYCFGCGEGGDVFDYVQRRDNLSFPEALRALAERAGIELQETGPAARGPKRSRLESCLADACAFYQNQLLRVRGDGPDAARAYLGGRGFGSAVCRRWGLGYAPGRGALVSYLRGRGYTRDEVLTADLAVDRNGRLQDRFYERAMFPICNERGSVIGMGGRVLGDGKPKYLNSKDSPVWHKSKNLFAYDRAKEGIVAAGTAIVVEGYTDAISLHEAGFTNVVAVLGTALTADHMKLLERLRPGRIVMMLDGDEAGQRAAEKAVRFLGTAEADMRSVVLPDNLDPAEFVAAHGADALRERLDAAPPLVEFVLEKNLAGQRQGSLGARNKTLSHLARVIAPLRDDPSFPGYVTLVADRLGLDAGRVAREARAAEPLGDEPGTDGAPQPAPAPDTFQNDYGADEPWADTDGPGSWSFESSVPPAPVVVSPGPVQSPASTRRSQLERELVCLMAESPDLMGPFSERVAQVSWSDPALQAMAWAMMMQPPGTSPAALVQAAEQAVPGAAHVLSGGSVGNAGEREVTLLLDSLEFLAAKQRVPQIRSLLSAWPDRPDADQLFREAEALKARIAELQDSFSKRG